MATRMQQRRGTAAEWTAANPILASGEIGYETDSNSFKIGDGVNQWSDLTYFQTLDGLDANGLITDAEKGVADGVATLDSNGYVPISQLQNLITDAPGTLDTLGEIATTLTTLDTTIASQLTIINDDVAAEIAAREAADTGLQSALDTLTTTTTNDINALELSVAAVESDLLDEVNTNRDAAITSAVDAAITQEVSDRNTAISTAVGQEVTDRNTAISDAIAQEVLDRDDAISTAIGVEEGLRNTAISTAVAAEATARDTAIAAAIAQEVIDRNAAIDDEATARDTAIGVALGALTTDDVAEGANKYFSDALAQAAVASDISNAIGQEVIDRNTAIGEHNGSTTNVHGIADTSLLETTAGAQSKADDAEAAAIATAAADATAKANTAETNANAFTTTEISDHNAETTNVHGIADTADLVVTADLTSAVADAETYADTQDTALIGDATVDGTVGNTVTDRIATAKSEAEASAAGYVTTHEATTTNIHGIADTADLALLSAADQTFDGNVTIAGNFTVTGTTTTVSTQDLVVNDPMIYIGEGSTGNTADLGLVASFDDGTYQHSGIVRDSSEGVWKLFKGVTDEPSTTINFAQGSLDDLAVNNIEVAGVVFADGTQTKVGVPSITPISEKTTAYTLSSTDERDTIIEVNSSSATTLTIPEDATLNFPVGTTLDVIQTGTGQVTIAGENGSVVVNATPGKKLRAQWSSVTLLKRAANSWLVFGDTSA